MKMLVSTFLFSGFSVFCPLYANLVSKDLIFFIQFSIQDSCFLFLLGGCCEFDYPFGFPGFVLLCFSDS